MSDHRTANDCSCYRFIGRSSEEQPALTSGCESPDPSPGCPRCAALTREGEEFFRYVHDVLLPARDELMANAEAKYVALSRERDEALRDRDAFMARANERRLEMEAAHVHEAEGWRTAQHQAKEIDAYEAERVIAERDLAQARQALAAFCLTCGHHADAHGSPVPVCLREDCSCYRFVAREALVERGTEQTDTGGSGAARAQEGS